EDHFAPVVSTQIHYRVGSYHEPKGLTGISHLLEHMAFKGTQKHGPKEYNRIIEGAGGYENAYTSIDRTVYYANLRSDRYEIELELEADRMQNLLMSPEEFIPEKAVVMEERRLRENDPYRSLFEQLGLVSYSYHPYRNPIIGFMADIERINRDDVYDWYRKNYNPANAIIVLAGDVDPDEAFRLVKKHYGKLKGMSVEEVEYLEPPQRGERRFVLKKQVNQPALAIHYHTVPVSHNDMYVLDVISMILSSGYSSRFEQNLVRKAGIATAISTYHQNLKYGGGFTIVAIPQTGVDIGTLEKEIYDEIDDLKSIAVSQEELNRAKKQALAQAVYQQDSAERIGYHIGQLEITGLGWQHINQYPMEIQEVSEEEIMEAAQNYFTRDSRTVGYLVSQEEK
ncbi:MAG: pitrilysin family protein, partial [bacterium]